MKCAVDWWSKTYLFDYTGILLAFVVLVLHKEIFPIPPQEAVFALSDLSIFNPIRDDTVPILDVFLLMAIPSAAQYVFVAWRRRDKLEDFHSAALGIAISLLLGNIIVTSCKFHITKPRPDFIMRCAPECMQNASWMCAPDVSLYTASCTADCCPMMCGRKDPRYPFIVDCTFDFGNVINAELTLRERCKHVWDIPISINQANCYGDNEVIHYSPYSIPDGLNSFPSGHISNIWGIYLFNWLYLAGKFGLYKRGNFDRMFLFPLVFMSMGMYVAFYVGMSRIADFKHDPYDIFFGALFTTIPVFIVYPMYFQSIFIGGKPLRRTQDVDLMSILVCE